MQKFPGAVQMPQLALQHTWPAAQVLLPHLSVPSETQYALPPTAWQRVPAAQRTDAHGSADGSGTHPQTSGLRSKT